METDPAKDDDLQGGSGGDQIHGAYTSNLVRRAVEQEWPMSAEQRAKVAKQIISVATNVKASKRARVSAARVAVAMHAQNLDEKRRADGMPDLTVDVRLRRAAATTLSDEELRLLVGLRNRAAAMGNP